jgi:hypothetical protein
MVWCDEHDCPSHLCEMLPHAKPYDANGFDIEDPRACSECGCTNTTPCVTAGVPCHWVSDDLCSACAEPMVILVSDAEASAFLRDRRSHANPS